MMTVGKDSIIDTKGVNVSFGGFQALKLNGFNIENKEK